MEEKEKFLYEYIDEYQDLKLNIGADGRLRLGYIQQPEHRDENPGYFDAGAQHPHHHFRCLRYERQLRQHALCGSPHGVLDYYRSDGGDQHGAGLCL